jgi:hypothetical protein
VTPQVDVEQLALYLPVETAAQAVADLRAQGLKAEAEQLEKAVQRKMNDLAKAKAEAEAAEEAARQRALADGREAFDAAVADFVALRDEALDHLADYIEVAQRAINEGASFQSIYSRMYSLLRDEDYYDKDGNNVDPLPELPESGMQIVQKDERFRGKFALSGGIPGGAVNR